jgi:4-amino-4-deoxy-L-arabinose transferase-like glycosyltransferase
MIAAATPVNAVLSLLMTIDAPLLFAWGAALYSFWRMLEAGKHQWRWVLATVISVGLGLLSKQTMLAFPVLGGIFVLTSREDRRKLLRPAFWIVSFGSLAFLAPTLWWNSQHGWITAEHTSQHFAREPVSWSTRLIRCAEFVGGQFGVFSPVTCFLILTVTAVAMATFWRFGRKERYLLCFSGPPLAGVFALSLMQRVEPNWPAVFYLPTIVLLVGQGLGHLDLRLWPKVDAAALRRAVVVGWVAVAATYLLAAGLGLQGTKLDAAVRLRGWRQLADAVSQRCAVLSSPGRTFLVVAAGRALASELAFYMPDQPRVYLWTPGDKIISQYDLWGGPKDKAGFDAIIVTPRDAAAPAELSAAFDRIEDCGLVEVPIGAGRSHGYRLWRGIRFSNWPDKPYLSRKSDMQVQRR